jgi:hypothetical protein
MKPTTLALALLVLSFCPACGESRAGHFSDARPAREWDASLDESSDGEEPDLTFADQAVDTESDVAIVEAPVDAAVTIREDAGLPIEAGDAAPIQSYQCGDGYVCLTSCENRCGLHELGRSTCLCQNGVLQCDDCQLTALTRPQVPTVVSATCTDGIASGSPCSHVGDACFLHPDSPYPDGCLCWATTTGMIWGCAPVFGWFSLPPDAGQ